MYFENYMLHDVCMIGEYPKAYVGIFNMVRVVYDLLLNYYDHHARC